MMRDTLYRRIDLRIVTLLLLAYLLDCIDRTNISFAQHQIAQRIGLSVRDYGFAAAIFFFGYVLFEIPSNLMLPHVGARRTFGRIMVLWGLTTAAMGMIHDRYIFYVMRFLLGVFEAGFAPAMLYYLAIWYPRERMSTVLSLQQLAVPFSGILTGLLSGFILQGMDHVAGLDGWRWMFVLEGLPSALLGLAMFRLLPDSPAHARWLTPDEAQWVQDRASSSMPSSHAHFGSVLRDRQIYLLAIGYFCVLCGMYTLGFWLPTLLRRAGAQNDILIGLLSAIPYCCATLALLAWGRRSDRHQERRWHCTIPAALGGLGLAGCAFAGDNMLLALAALSFTASSIYCAYLIFLSVPSDIFKGEGSVGGYALINSLGLTGGFVSPMIIGWTTQLTGTVVVGMLCMSTIMLFGAVMLATFVPGGQRPPAPAMATE